MQHHPATRGSLDLGEPVQAAAIGHLGLYWQNTATHLSSDAQTKWAECGSEKLVNGSFGTPLRDWRFFFPTSISSDGVAGSGSCWSFLNSWNDEWFGISGHPACRSSASDDTYAQRSPASGDVVSCVKAGLLHPHDSWCDIYMVMVKRTLCVYGDSGANCKVTKNAVCVQCESNVITADGGCNNVGTRFHQSNVPSQLRRLQTMCNTSQPCTRTGSQGDTDTWAATNLAANS